MKIFVLFLIHVNFALLPVEEFQSLFKELTNTIPKTKNGKLKNVIIEFSYDPLEIILKHNNERYATIKEISNGENYFLKIEFDKKDPDLSIFKAYSKIVSEDNKLKNVD